MTADPLQNAASTLAALFQKVRDQVDLSNTASDTLAVAQHALAARPVAVASLAPALANIEQACEACLAAVREAEEKKRHAETTGQQTVAAHVGLPDPSSKQLAQLHHDLSQAFPRLASALARGGAA